MNRNKKLGKKWMAGVAVGMAGMMGTMPVYAAEGSAPVSKEETVYVNADATGSETQITVSDWLKNAGTEAVVKDQSVLEGIKNVKGEETFEHTNGNVTWQTDGKDIYYQGTSKKELPVSVKFTYFLDGAEILPENLKGKSGKLKIKIDYDNKAKQEAVIDGKKEEIYSPFVMVTGLILPEENFSNVVIDNGKVISDGERNIVLGVGMPGLKESLGLDQEDASSAVKDITLPESLEITADVTNFTMDPTFTVALSDLLEDLNLDDTEDLDSVMNALDDLEDAALQLVDGSSELSKGADTLGSSYQEFDAGIATLKSGIDVLKSGVSELSGGINSYTEGADTLNAGIQQYMGKDGALNSQVTEYVNGVNKVVKGVEDYTTGSVALADGITSYIKGEEQIANGAGQLTQLETGLTEIKDAITALNQAVDGQGDSSQDLYAASQALAQGTQKLNDTLEEMSKLMTQVDAMTEAGKNLTAQAGSLAQEVQAQILEPVKAMMSTGTQMMEALQSLTGQLENMKAMCQSAVQEAAKKAADQVNTQVAEKNAQIESVKGNAQAANSQVDAAIAQLNTQIANANAKGDTETANALQATVATLSGAKVDTGSLNALSPVETPSVNTEIPTPDFSQLQSMVSGMQTHFASLETAVNAFGPKIAAMNELLNQLASQSIPDKPMENLKGAVVKLNTGMQGLNKAMGILSSQVGTLNQATDSLPEAVAGIKALTSGIQELSQANPSLLQGVEMLKANTPTLVEGVKTLSGGTTQLSSGLTALGGELSNGSAALSANSNALRQGASSLLGGTDQLVSGAGTLQSASGEVKSGISALQDGALQLKDGTVEFNEEGIKKLQETAEDLLGTILDRVDALTSETCSYDSYAGKADNMEGNVKFIIETEGIQ